MVKWIDITEQLPTSSKEVLVRCKHSVKHYGIAKYESGSWWEYFADDSIKGWAAFEGEITHWMDIENLQKPASEDLEQAAIDYDSCRPALYGEDDEGDYVEYIEVRKDAFIAGAEWMARRFSKLYAEKFLSMQVQEPIPESIQKVIDDHFWEML